ncbi:hypothetical protein N8J89_27345 [Crossiella sp. CA-258035]|uniref:hypothetical protein n=1 Tax=Crossiella sp. CA-258035 TaxID=2981138 RepID=UPI0024BCEF77|nr:hypothetical protein [Crossiella sp. CA-258035]WHT16836.1 hypothetical protein N8J89_27345 [Crossiella sp. CA-258035]
MTVVSPGYVETEIVHTITNLRVRTQIDASRTEFALPPAAIARGIAFAIGQPANVDVGDIVVHPTAQS